jgi:hypothetical protein
MLAVSPSDWRRDARGGTTLRHHFCNARMIFEMTQSVWFVWGMAGFLDGVI